MAGVNADQSRSRRNRGARTFASFSLLAFVAAGLSGCANDLNSWWDPSIVGRWEYTPTTVPILERIDVIESDSGDFVETTEIMPEDLIPEAIEYEIGPGDQLLLEIFDFLAPNVPSQFQRVVDGRGNIDLPQIGRINVNGLTATQVEMRLVEILREQGIIQDALVTVQALAQRDATYSVYGAIGRVGRYLLPAPNYRLLDALTEAGGVPPFIEHLYVIRQVPLSDAVTMGEGVEPAPTPGQPRTPQGQAPGVNLEDLIEQLTEPENPGSPAAFASAQGGQSTRNDPPLIDLLDDQPTPRENRRPSAGEAESREGQWVFLNGEWVRVEARPGGQLGGLGEAPDPLMGGLGGADELITQRIIKVPLAPLLQGNASYNIVVRPGDAIHIPSPEQGLVYVAGRGIARPGVYNLPTIGRLTLTKAILAAGGLSPVGIPDRTDLTRMVGSNRQATIRLNLKAIFEGSEPDVFLRRDDVINVGTTWWAQPLAIIRNGFRTTYGFGFLLDRNFGNDVFGAPPVNRGF